MSGLAPSDSLAPSDQLAPSDGTTTSGGGGGGGSGGVPGDLLTLTREKGRVRISGTAVAGTLVTITRRHPSGRILPVRGGELIPLSGGAYLLYDYEMPLGVPVTYVAQVFDASDTDTPLDTSDAVTITWVSTNEWLKDPLEPIRNMAMRVNQFNEWDYASPTAVHTVLGRPDPVTIGEIRQAATGEITFYTLDKTERDRLHYITSSGHILLIQSSQESGIGNMYVASLGLREVNPGLRDQPDRLWTMSYQEVAMPVGAGAPVVTYQDLLNTYTTYQDVKDSANSYLELIEGLDATAAPPILAWRGA